MSMRRADYIVIINAIKKFRSHFNELHPDTTDEQNALLKRYNDDAVIEVLCSEIKASNPLFSKEKFLEQMAK